MAIQIRLQELPDPKLEFGGVGEFTDPKIGLREAGPYDLRFGNARNAEVRVGLVGTPDMLIKAKKWFAMCQGNINSTMSNLVQYPNFPGFKSIFRSSLNLNPRWEVSIDQNDLTSAVSKKNDSEAFEAVLEMYSKAIRRLANVEFTKPHVVICCLPEEVIERCWSIKNKLNTSSIKKAKKASAQLSLFDLVPEIEETSEDLLNRDFRRALKAKAMEHQMPIQLGTDRLFLESAKGQDAATRAWHSMIGIYYKSGGIPWRLRNDGPETCFVGISFHHLYTTNNRHLVRSCIAQAFSSDGEGFAIRGANIPWEADQGRNVHLTIKQASELGSKILEHYRERTGSTPMRIVVHKTSLFNEDEIEGLRTSLANVPIVELINLSPTDFRLVRHGEYPPKRGTLCRVNDNNSYLYTTGFMPDLKTYPGPHIPAPIQIKSDSPIDVERVSIDILGLSRMNWNTSSITSGYPVTLYFARKVGGIMAEYGEKEPLSSFRYYI